MRDPARTEDELRVLKLALSASRQLDLHAVAEIFVRAVMGYGQADAALLYVYDSEHDVFHLAASHLAPDDPRRRGVLTADLAELRGEGPPGTWIPTVRPTPDGLKGLELAEVLAVPLPGAGTLLGMLLLGNLKGPMTVEAMDRVGRLVPELLPALVNALLVEQYRNLVIKDDQSDCFNRRYFERFLSEEVYRAHRYSSALALIFLDLDNLREVNARFGHTMGSRTVREVSRSLVSMIRGSDRAFRYGGDEFCIVLPATDLTGARDLAERLRLCLSSSPLRIDAATTLTITASFGISSYPEHARTSLGLVKSADEAMQRAKASGKNSLAMAGSEQPEVSRAQGGKG